MIIWSSISCTAFSIVSSSIFLPFCDSCFNLYSINSIFLLRDEDLELRLKSIQFCLPLFHVIKKSLLSNVNFLTPTFWIFSVITNSICGIIHQSRLLGYWSSKLYDSFNNICDFFILLTRGDSKISFSLLIFSSVNFSLLK